MDEIDKISQYIDPNNQTTFTSGLKVNFRIKSDNLSNSKRKSLRRFLDTASLANQCCIICSRTNLFGQNENRPKVDCVISKDFERCLLCFMLDKTQAACGVDKTCGPSKDTQNQSKKGESSTRPKPRPRRREPVSTTQRISSSPEPVATTSKKRKGKERERDQGQAELLKEASSSSSAKRRKVKSVRDRNEAHQQCEKCSCCSCVNHLDRAFQQIRQIEREKFEQKENMTTKMKELEHSIEKKDQTIASLMRKKVSDKDYVANLRKEVEIYKAKDGSARKRIYELEKALRNVRKCMKDV